MGGERRAAHFETLGALVRAQRLAAGLSLRGLAGRALVSNAYLSELERGMHDPSLGVIVSIAAALGIPLESLLGRAGVLVGANVGTWELDTEASILGDRDLSEPQRTALLSVYRSFITANRDLARYTTR